ncbi:galactose-binding domain-like protein [Jimgerdemannia flammicorona]|uniref:Galactose-binding domain-like protein n=1 Tax=Jimgerdemannia flammicorona TaxID=994334 RepID=A0A433QEA3_9FUNG|nr:galactose-binding domain-like protein [Jimgerdemannia flammicorona]
MGNANSKPDGPLYSRIEVPRVDDCLLFDYVDLAANSYGSTIVAVSDQFFSSADNLLKPKSPKKYEDEYGDNGPLSDGWETKRHNTGGDWVIVKLGFQGTIRGFDIDTTHYEDNYPPKARVEACFVEEDGIKKEVEPEYQWKLLLPTISIKRSSHNFFAIPDTDDIYTHVRLTIIPDGGVVGGAPPSRAFCFVPRSPANLAFFHPQARFRVYGTCEPKWTPSHVDSMVDLAFAGNGGRVVSVSTQQPYGRKENLLLPGRGLNGGDGWETKRSRTLGHRDWAVVKLGAAGHLEKVEIDTNHFKGNHPEAARIEACYTVENNPDLDVDIEWIELLPKTRLQGHTQQFFTLTPVTQPFTHVRLTIFPDGGVKRLRVYGRLAEEKDSKQEVVVETSKKVEEETEVFVKDENKPNSTTTEPENPTPAPLTSTTPPASSNSTAVTTSISTSTSSISTISSDLSFPLPPPPTTAVTTHPIFKATFPTTPTRSTKAVRAGRGADGKKKSRAREGNDEDSRSRQEVEEAQPQTPKTPASTKRTRRNL